MTKASITNSLKIHFTAQGFGLTALSFLVDAFAFGIPTWFGGPSGFVNMRGFVDKALQSLKRIYFIALLRTKLLCFNDKHAFFGDSAVFTV